MSSREAILAKLRDRCAGNSGNDFYEQPDIFIEAINGSPLEHFVALVTEQASSVDRLDSLDDAAVAIAAYLQRMKLPGRVVLEESLNIRADGFAAENIEAVRPPLRPDHDVLVSGCYGAVAESGTIVISTDDGHAIANDFLAETHIVVLPADRIFRSLPDLWAALRRDAGGGFMPREFCLVTGPSRTADLGVPAKMGAHGPARVHILLVGSP